VDDDADVGDVDEPERLVEGGPGEDVPGGIVPERGVSRAAEQEIEDGGHAEAVEGGALHGAVLGGRRAQRVLDLDEDVGEGVGEGDVAEREEHVERLGRGEGAAGQRAAEVAVGGPLGGAQAQADEGVAERGGHRHHGQPRDVVEARELREEELEQPEHHHVRAPRRVAVARAVALPVEAVHATNRAVRQTNSIAVCLLRMYCPLVKIRKFIYTCKIIILLRSVCTSC
jgi:hypothetical protein